MKAEKYLFDGSRKCELEKLPTNSKQDGVVKQEITRLTEANLGRMAELQEMLFAEGKEGMIVVLQALDAAGKDSTIKHVMGGFNPQGVHVYNFKAPNSEELAHDYLWRINKCLPRRGEISIFNRSHYEDLITVQIHDFQNRYKMADRVLKKEKKEFFEQRYRQVKDYEEYLYENSYRIVKIFLHVSKEKQKERFLERIDLGEKNWKFSSNDMPARALYDTYTGVFNDVITKTGTEHSPWYAVPADQKWYTRYLVSEILIHELEKIDPHFPVLPEEEKAKLAECRRILVEEQE